MGNRHETEKSVCVTQRTQIIWTQINWEQVKRDVEHLQQKIFREVRISNYKNANHYQKLLVQSLAARSWAVKTVTEINQGRNTPGIDGRLYKTDEDKVNLVESLSLKGYKPDPVTITWIPKQDGTLRRLGIPTIRDRVMQSLILSAMNPEWEAKFEPHSFGFRPGRSAIDAIHHMAVTLMHYSGRKPHPGWVFDADISKCFDTIDHNALLSKVGGSPFGKVINAWLKSGAISQVGFERTEKGTPQGGVISPLLANIALDGLERLFGIYTRTCKYIQPSGRRGLNKNVATFRYADDFIILAPSREVIVEYIIPKVKTFLASIGLSLNEAKTRVVNINEGFEFLGFKFQRFHRRDGSIRELVYSPSRKRLDKFLEKIKEFIHRNWNRDVKDLIQGLNLRVRGFCNYFKWSHAWGALTYLSHHIWRLLWQWAKRRHHGQSSKWLKNHYWKSIGTRKWVFQYQGITLVEPCDLAVQWWMWPKVRIFTSPYDQDAAEYWQARKEHHKHKQEASNS